MVNVNFKFYPFSNYFSNLLNSPSVKIINFNSYSVICKNIKSLVSNSSSVMYKIFYNQSLFFAINNQVIAEEFHKYKSSSWAQKFKIGVITGAKTLLITYLIGTCLDFALCSISPGNVATSGPPSILEGLACAVLEELLSRGVLQNCLAGSQKIAICITPQYLQNNRVFKWLTSPSARIIVVNLIFAFIHLTNGGDYLSDKDSLIQSILIMLQPSESILHETTGNIIAPIACHMTNNFIAFSLYAILNKQNL